jgi:hypothetical protein
VSDLVDGEDWRGRRLEGETFTGVTFLDPGASVGADVQPEPAEPERSLAPEDTATRNR